MTPPFRKHQIANLGARHCSSDFVFRSTWEFSSMCLSGHRYQYMCHGNKSANKAAHNRASTREHTVRGLIRPRESTAMDKDSCIAVVTRVRNSKRDQIPSGSKRKTDDRDLQRSKYWRFGVVGHANSLRTNAAIQRVAASKVSKSEAVDPPLRCNGLFVARCLKPSFRRHLWISISIFHRPFRRC